MRMIHGQTFQHNPITFRPPAGRWERCKECIGSDATVIAVVVADAVDDGDAAAVSETHPPPVPSPCHAWSAALSPAAPECECFEPRPTAVAAGTTSPWSMPPYTALEMAGTAVGKADGGARAAGDAVARNALRARAPCPGRVLDRAPVPVLSGHTARGHGRARVALVPTRAAAGWHDALAPAGGRG